MRYGPTFPLCLALSLILAFPLFASSHSKPIHIPGAVQGFGVLIALEEDLNGNLVVRVVSEVRPLHRTSQNTLLMSFCLSSSVKHRTVQRSWDLHRLTCLIWSASRIRYLRCRPIISGTISSISPIPLQMTTLLTEMPTRRPRYSCLVGMANLAQRLIPVPAVAAKGPANVIGAVTAALVYPAAEHSPA